jgi:hypothetical protein
MDAGIGLWSWIPGTIIRAHSELLVVANGFAGAVSWKISFIP